MDENYYQDLIDRVCQNEEGMWEQSEETNEGYDDFRNLWGILSDNDSVSADTFMSAIELCLTSFFGADQGHKIVWESVIDYYKKALADPAKEDEFRNAFSAFAETYSENEDPDCASQFIEMMHMAITAGDVEMAYAITDCALCEDIWINDDAYPEWSVWFSVFSDKDFLCIPKSQKAVDTVRELNSNIGHNPELDRLRALREERPCLF